MAWSDAWKGLNSYDSQSLFCQIQLQIEHPTQISQWAKYLKPSAIQLCSKNMAWSYIFPLFGLILIEQEVKYVCSLLVSCR